MRHVALGELPTSMDVTAPMAAFFTEAAISPARRWVEPRARLMAIMDAKAGSIRVYNLAADGQRRVEHVSAHKPLDLDGPLLL